MAGPITVGTDGSGPAAAAIRWAADEAARRGLPLRIVNVRAPWSYGTGYYSQPGVLDRLDGVGEQLLAGAVEIARELQPELKVTTKLLYGRVAECLGAAATSSAEIVVGHRGLGGFTGLMLGAIGQRVAGHVAAPVIVVRGDTTGGQDEVVVGVDPAEADDTVLTYASEAAFRRGALLRIVHGLTIPPMYLETGYFPLANEIEQEVGTSLKSLTDTWQTRHPEIKVVEHLVREHPVHALVKASAHADLVVVGSRSRIGLGSISHGAIHHAACPVAVIRTRS